MKTNWKAINSELRLPGRIMKVIFNVTSENKMRNLQKLMKRLLVGKQPKRIEFEEVFIETDENKALRICLYKPRHAQGPLPVVLWFHGGGYAIGAPEMDLQYYEWLIERRPCVIVSPDYRLSTQSPFPAAFEDCLSTLKWIQLNPLQLSIKLDHVILAGVSAGGGLAAAVSLAARDLLNMPIAFQMLLYPMLDDRMTATSVDNHAPVWNTKNNETAWKLYLSDQYGTQEVSKYAAPARESQFEKLPPLYTFIGTEDPFYCEVLAYCDALKRAGVEVTLDLYEGGYHGFEKVAPHSRLGKSAIENMLTAFEHAIDHYRMR